MFTNKDYEDYFKEIRKIELGMITTLDNIIKDITDKKITKILEQIKKDEFNHLALVDEILKLISKK